MVADNDNDDDCAECWQPRDVVDGGGYDDGRGRGRGRRAVNVNIKHGRGCLVVMCPAARAGACVGKRMGGIMRNHERPVKSKTVSFKSALVLGDW